GDREPGGTAPDLRDALLGPAPWGVRHGAGQCEAPRADRLGLGADRRKLHDELDGASAAAARAAQKMGEQVPEAIDVGAVDAPVADLEQQPEPLAGVEMAPPAR